MEFVVLKKLYQTKAAISAMPLRASLLIYTRCWLILVELTFSMLDFIGDPFCEWLVLANRYPA
jgi:hypothetical protein